MGKSKYFLFLIASPIFWYLIFQAPKLVRNWSNFPKMASQKIKYIFSLPNIRYSTELVWENGDVINSRLITSRIFFNKGSVLISEFFKLSDNLNPRNYFIDGDNGELLPRGIEPIPIVLLPLWFYGIYLVVSQKKIMPFILTFVVAIPAYLADQKSLYFLFPVALIYVYFVSIGFSRLTKKSKNIYCMVTGVYLLFLLLSI